MKHEKYHTFSFHSPTIFEFLVIQWKRYRHVIKNSSGIPTIGQHIIFRLFFCVFAAISRTFSSEDGVPQIMDLSSCG